MITIVLAEDQSLVCGALTALLEMEADLHVVAQCADGEEALRAVEQHRPDVVVTDIEMPKLSGLDLAAAIAARKLPTRVVIITTFGRAGYLRRALEAGVAGYLLKDRPAAELADAVRSVHSGGRAIDPELAAGAWDERDPLSERERDVLRRAGEGATSATIAAHLGLSEGTVRNYLSEAIGKMGASNRVEAARLARERGWL